MTLVSQIVKDAFRQSNILALGVEPTDLQKEEALRYLSRIVKSVFGNEAGDALESFPVGNNDISRPSGYPWWNTVPDNEWFVPKNIRVMLNVTASLPLYLHPAPDDGSRFAAVDVSGTLDTAPVTVFGNGNRIDGEVSTVLDVAGFDGEWFYRADLANWVRYSPLVEDGLFPFPEEFDDFFITMLAIRLNPAYGASVDAQSSMVLNRSKSQLRARYTQNIPVHSELALIRPARTAADRDVWGNSYWLYQPNSMFDKGWPF